MRTWRFRLILPTEDLDDEPTVLAIVMVIAETMREAHAAAYAEVRASHSYLGTWFRLEYTTPEPPDKPPTGGIRIPTALPGVADTGSQHQCPSNLLANERLS